MSRKVDVSYTRRRWIREFCVVWSLPPIMGIVAWLQTHFFPSPYIHDSTGFDIYMRWMIHGLAAFPFALAILIVAKVFPSRKHNIEMNQQKVLIYCIFAASATTLSAFQDFIYKFNDNYKPFLIVSTLALFFNLLVVFPTAHPFLSKDDSS